MRLYWRLPLPIRPKQSCLYPSTDNARIWMPSMRLQKSIIFLLSKMRLKVLVLLTKVKNPVIYQPSVAHPSFHPNHLVVMEMEEHYLPMTMSWPKSSAGFVCMDRNASIITQFLALMDVWIPSGSHPFRDSRSFSDEVQKRQNLGQTYSEGLAILKVWKPRDWRT